MNDPLIINIQKYSLHDGDGIRTTLFFKGCMLRCAWCHNPESQSYKKELMFDKKRCEGCGQCSQYCPHHAITVSVEQVAVTDENACTLCAECTDYCPHQNREIVGEGYTVRELLKIIDQDACFYEESGGGVTLSGGEVLSQNMDFIETLCKGIKGRGYHLAVDTCGYALKENYRRLLPYVDVFLYDIKILDDEIHKQYMGQSNSCILENLEFLAKHHAGINIRIPVVEPVNNDEETMKAIIIYVKETIGMVKINLLPYHNTGSSKYERLGRPYPARELCTPSEAHMNNLKALWEQQGFLDVKIGG